MPVVDHFKKDAKKMTFNWLLRLAAIISGCVLIGLMTTPFFGIVLATVLGLVLTAYHLLELWSLYKQVKNKVVLEALEELKNSDNMDL